MINVHRLKANEYSMASYILESNLRYDTKLAKKTPQRFSTTDKKSTNDSQLAAYKFQSLKLPNMSRTKVQIIILSL